MIMEAPARSAEQVLAGLDFEEAGMALSPPPQPQAALIVKERSSAIRLLGDKPPAVRVGLLLEKGVGVLVVLIKAGQYAARIYPVWCNPRRASDQTVLAVLSGQPFVGVQFYGSSGRRERTFIVENPCPAFRSRWQQALERCLPWSDEEFGKAVRSILARHGGSANLWEAL